MKYIRMFVKKSLIFHLVVVLCTFPLLTILAAAEGIQRRRGEYRLAIRELWDHAQKLNNYLED